MATPELHSTAHHPPKELVRDEITRTIEKTWDELFGLDRHAAEEWQLKAARSRFEELAPQLSVLKSRADDVGLSKIGNLSDIPALLFDHSTYKSYPMSVIEKGRFDLLTKWLAGLTSVDLSGISAGECEGIDDWLALLERETPLQIFHTTGTTGKLSFIPRTTLEEKLWFELALKSYQGFGKDKGLKIGDDGARMPVIVPAERSGRYTNQRFVKYLTSHVAPTPDQCYTSSEGFLSADVVSLSGRIRVAQAKGNLASMRLSDSQRLALKAYLKNLDDRPKLVAEFFARISSELKGQQVFLCWHASYLLKAALAGLARGQSDVFAHNSVGCTGGGNKDMILPGDWLQTVTRYLGIEYWNVTYGMSETTGVKSRCQEGYYHIAPYYVPFLIDPQSGAALPREGRQTGRYAELDLLAPTFWGGVVSSDKVTIEWDRPCACGRKGAYIFDDIVRYDASVTGDDKVTCASTINYDDVDLQRLLDV